LYQGVLEGKKAEESQNWDEAFSFLRSLLGSSLRMWGTS